MRLVHQAHDQLAHVLQVRLDFVQKKPVQPVQLRGFVIQQPDVLPHQLVYRVHELPERVPVRHELGLVHLPELGHHGLRAFQRRHLQGQGEGLERRTGLRQREQHRDGLVKHELEVLRDALPLDRLVDVLLAVVHELGDPPDLVVQVAGPRGDAADACVRKVLRGKQVRDVAPDPRHRATHTARLARLHQNLGEVRNDGLLPLRLECVEENLDRLVREMEQGVDDLLPVRQWEHPGLFHHHPVGEIAEQQNVVLGILEKVRVVEKLDGVVDGARHVAHGSAFFVHRQHCVYELLLRGG
mmetsp:Transcript_8051/g.19422  ORF Transcript_8051/g.19422 Transcript_8051/m.19422 type:complete len:298 (+) Transcript_8051:771-1664(+)